jgi:hypothetical protein
MKHKLLKLLEYHVTGAINRGEKTTIKAIVDDQNEKETDPTPYCSACGAKTEKYCKCGPIAENN